MSIWFPIFSNDSIQVFYNTAQVLEALLHPSPAHALYDFEDHHFSSQIKPSWCQESLSETWMLLTVFLYDINGGTWSDMINFGFFYHQNLQFSVCLHY